MFKYLYYFSIREVPNDLKMSVIDRWPTHPLLARTFANIIQKELAYFPENKRKDVVILFSAHSLPLKVYYTLLSSQFYMYD